ncbi:MAG: DUF4157 domain-containing protein [Rhodospirillales bacterium]|nr:MAG: DUF4157 domain-containing protein [Rhodospirillales bacterium]
MFSGLPRVLLDDIAVINEEDDAGLTTPVDNDVWYDCDGFWYRHRAQWFKIPDHCRVEVTDLTPAGARYERCCNLAASLLREGPHWSSDALDNSKRNPFLGEDAEGATLQRRPARPDVGAVTTGLTVPPGAESAVRSLGSGIALPAAERAFFEPRFGRSFAHVRIHDGTQADAAATDLNARAFTLGNHIAFARNQYSPGTAEGRALMAHELTHVVQQSAAGSPSRIQRNGGMSQTLSYRQGFRYQGDGAFRPNEFEPDLQAGIREWLVRHLSVFTVERPFDAIAAHLVAAFERGHRALGAIVSLTRGRRYAYRARIRVSGATVSITNVAINGRPVPDAAAAAREPEQAPVALTPALEGWWSALMSSFRAGTSDGREEFEILLRLAPGQEPELGYWRRRTIEPGRQRMARRLDPPASFGRQLRAALDQAIGSAAPELGRRVIVVARQGRTWSIETVGTVSEPTPARPGDEIILDRRQLYGAIFREWEQQLTDISIRMAGFVGEEIIWWVVGGVIFRALGGVLRRLPILQRVLSFRRFEELGEGLGRLSRQEADDFIRIMRRLRRGQAIPAAEAARLEAIAVRLEAQLAIRAPASLAREEMIVFLRELWRDNPILARVANAQRQTGRAQHRELIAILEQFERQTGVGVQFVEQGTVQASRGVGNLASLRSSPGVLQIERQVLSDTPTLMTEVRHEMAFYYSSLSGRTPVLGHGPLNALQLLEMMIESGGRLPL